MPRRFATARVGKAVAHYTSGGVSHWFYGRQFVSSLSARILKAFMPSAFIISYGAFFYFPYARASVER